MTVSCRYGAHNYHPLPVAVDRAQGRLALQPLASPSRLATQASSYGMWKDVGTSTSCLRTLP